MKQNKNIVWNIFVSVFFVLLIATFVFSMYKFTRHADPTEIAIFSAKKYAADKPVSIILFARDAGNQTPLRDQNIGLSVNGKSIPSIKTKEDGTALLVLKKYPKEGFAIRARVGECIVEKCISLGNMDELEFEKVKKQILELKPVGSSKNRYLERSICTTYHDRRKMLKRMKQVYGENLFSISLVVLFSIFLILLICFMRLWFSPDMNESILIVPEQLAKRFTDNIIIAITGFAILITIFVFIVLVMKTEHLSILRPEEIIRNSTVVSLGILYIVILAGLLYRSFNFRNLILKVPSNEAGERVKKSVFFLSPLLVVFLLFEHVYLFGLGFFHNIEWLFVLAASFQALATIWIFCAWGINNFIYSQNEYDNIQQYGAKKIVGLGTGLGVYPTSFYKTWILGGVLYWGIPVFIYFWVVVVIISMFLPLCKIIEKLG